MVAIMGVGLLALAGLVVDGGRALHARARAVAYAEEAARTAVQHGLDRTTDPLKITDNTAPQAELWARQYCATASVKDSTLDCSKEVVDVATGCVTVTLSVTIQTGLLDIIGIKELSGTGTGKAQAAVGRDAADPGQTVAGC